MTRTAAAVSEELTGSIRELAALDTAPSVKGRLAALSRRIGLPFSRARQYWYGEITCQPAHEADLIRAYYKAAHELREARASYEKQLEEFVRNHPNLAFAVPGTTNKVETKQNDATVVAIARPPRETKHRVAQQITR